MPLPKPIANELRQNFISRCISELTKKGEFKGVRQRTAVCFDIWSKSKKPR